MRNKLAHLSAFDELVLGFSFGTLCSAAKNTVVLLGIHVDRLLLHGELRGQCETILPIHGHALHLHRRQTFRAC